MSEHWYDEDAQIDVPSDEDIAPVDDLEAQESDELGDAGGTAGTKLWS